MSEIEIFTKASCGWAERNYAALEEKKIAYRIVPSCDKAGRKTREFLSLSPFARTPTLRHGAFVLAESALINEFLDERFPQRPMLSRDPGERAWARLWIHHCDQTLLPSLSRLLTAEVGAKTEAHAAMNRALDRVMERGLRHLAPNPFWGGESIGLVDLAYHTFFQSVEYVQGMKDDPQIELHGIFENWRQAIARHSSVRKAREVALAVPFADETETQ